MAKVFHMNPRIGEECCALGTNIQCQYTGNKETGEGFEYSCPDDFPKRTHWTCVSGTTYFGCGECSNEDNIPPDPPAPECYYGPWGCSIWWNFTP